MPYGFHTVWPVRRCPRCRCPDAARRRLFSTWGCEGCSAALRRSRFYFGLWSSLAVAGIVLHAVTMRFPFDLIGAVMAVAGVNLFLFFPKVVVVSNGPCCRVCLYDLSRLPDGAPCPECGDAPARR